MVGKDDGDEMVMSKNKYVAIVMVVFLMVSLTLLAGCLGGDSDDTGTQTQSQGATDSNVKTDGAIDPSKSAKCPICGMMPARHPKWNAQIIFKDGASVQFDVPKDLLKYRLNPDTYFPEGKTVEGIKGVYFTDYYTTNYVKMDKELYFIKDSDILGPMGKDLVPVKGKRNAESFQGDHGGRIINSENVTKSVVNEVKKN